MMIAKLRRKLTLASICSLLAILLVMIGLINAVSFYSSQYRVSQSLETLSGSQSSGDTARVRENLPGVTASSLYQVSNYCIIRLTRTGELYEWKSENTQLYTDETVAQLLRQIQDTGKKQGRVGSKMFRIEQAQRGDRIAVIDIQSELTYAASLLKITLAVGLAFWVILSALAVVLIRRVLSPVDEAFSKQQQFVWDASHELKTPLAVISANAQALAREVGESESLHYILGEVDRTNALVRNLLELARMDAGRPKGEMQTFDLGKALLQAALPMESLAFEQGKTMKLEVPEGVFYTGNPGLLLELAVILLSNAISYSDAGSEITLSLRARGTQRVLTVHNTGSWIDPEARKHIFERFYRGDTSHNREDGGTGLGLAIAKSIVELHRGTIRVESSPETGTAFLVTLTERDK